MGIFARSRELPVAGERSLVQRLERAGATTWLLLAAATWALLLWLAALSGMGGHLRATTVLAADPLPPPTPSQPARIGPLTQYAEAASRPLFTQDRRPRSFIATNPDGGEGAAVQAQTLDFILTGVLISPQVQLAILQPTAGGEPQRVRVGKSPEGAESWQLLSLEPRRAIFAGGGSQVTLDLRTYGTAGKPVAPSMPQAGVVGAAVTDANATASVATSVAPTAVLPAVPAPPAPGADVPQTDQARIEAIRQRIEARRAQQRAASQTSGAPTPQKP